MIVFKFEILILFGGFNRIVINDGGIDVWYVIKGDGVLFEGIICKWYFLS